ncbi:MAG: hypothetical protein WCX22_08690 [Methanoregula sp.]
MRSFCTSGLTLAAVIACVFMACLVIGVAGANPDNSTTGIPPAGTHPSATQPSGTPPEGNGSPAEHGAESSGATVFMSEEGLNLSHAMNQSAVENASQSPVPTQKASPLIYTVLGAIAVIGITSAVQGKGRL